MQRNVSVVLLVIAAGILLLPAAARASAELVTQSLICGGTPTGAAAQPLTGTANLTVINPAGSLAGLTTGHLHMIPTTGAPA